MSKVTKMDNNSVDLKTVGSWAKITTSVATETQDASRIFISTLVLKTVDRMNVPRV